MNRERELDSLIEAAVTPYRELDVEGRIVPPPAWWDLPEEARGALFARQLLTREMERAADPAGQSGTVRAVLVRLGR
jgi:hypothetical protein